MAQGQLMMQQRSVYQMSVCRLQVFSAPTSAGKSLVAEVLMLRRIQETRKPALMVRAGLVRRHAVSCVTNFGACMAHYNTLFP